MSCPSIISLPTSQSPVPPWNGNCRVGQGGIPISLTRKMRARVFSPFPTRDKQGSSIITSPQVHKPLASKVPFPELQYLTLSPGPPSHGPRAAARGRASWPSKRQGERASENSCIVRPMARAKRCLDPTISSPRKYQGLGTGMHAQP